MLLINVSILLGCGAASLGDWCSKFCNNVGVSSSKQYKKNASFLQFMAPEGKTTMLSQNMTDQSPSYATSLESLKTHMVLFMRLHSLN